MAVRLPERVRIVEVGPRDGLQNEAQPVGTAEKLAFISALADAGLAQIEVTSFVNPKKIPQLADAAEVAAGLERKKGVTYSALVPNLKGLERAVACDIRRIAVFTAASDTFTEKNIGMTIPESLKTFAEVAAAAKKHGQTVRGYISTCFVCPYEGEVDKKRVREVAEALIAIGCDEISISDTIGAAAPRDVLRTVGHVLERVPLKNVALHFHDTYGTALANVYAGLELGVTTYDSSAGGLGGCPFAPGAAGNLATEDLIYMLDRMEIETGAKLEGVAAASAIIEKTLGRELPSKQLKRLKTDRRRRR